jgi:hypothetical protein
MIFSMLIVLEESDDQLVQNGKHLPFWWWLRHLEHRRAITRSTEPFGQKDHASEGVTRDEASTCYSHGFVARDIPSTRRKLLGEKWALEVSVYGNPNRVFPPISAIENLQDGHRLCLTLFLDTSTTHLIQSKSRTTLKC